MSKLRRMKQMQLPLDQPVENLVWTGLQQRKEKRCVPSNDTAKTNTDRRANSAGKP